jgi:regulator of nucleoside diphosphate kinase
LAAPAGVGFNVEDEMHQKSLLGDPPEIRVNSRDLGQLDRLLSAVPSASPVFEFLRREVDRATVVDDASAGVPFVQLGSRVTFEDESGRFYIGKVGFPGQLVGCPDVISILTPVGSALFGLSEGQSIAYETPDGRIKTLTALRISPGGSRDDRAGRRPG